MGDVGEERLPIGILSYTLGKLREPSLEPQGALETGRAGVDRHVGGGTPHSARMISRERPDDPVFEVLEFGIQSAADLLAWDLPRDRRWDVVHPETARDAIRGDLVAPPGPLDVGLRDPEPVDGPLETHLEPQI